MDAAAFDRACEGKPPAFARALLAAVVARGRADRAFSRYDRTRTRRDRATYTRAAAAYDAARRQLENHA